MGLGSRAWGRSSTLNSVCLYHGPHHLPTTPKVKHLEPTLRLIHCYGRFAQMDRDMTPFNSFDCAGLDQEYESRPKFAKSAEILGCRKAAGADVRKQFSADFGTGFLMDD